MFSENFRLGVKSSLFGEMCIKCGVLTDSLLEILIYLRVPFCFACCIDCENYFGLLLTVSVSL